MEEPKTFDNVPEADVIVRYINARFRYGLGTNVIFIGLSGTGKSSSSIRVGEIIIKSRKEENIKLNITDSLLKLLDAIRSSKEGDVIVVEEISVLFPSRRAMSGENLAIAKIFDTIRKKRLCLIANAPLWTSIDSHLKSMCHVLVQTIKIYKEQGVVVSKFWRIQTNPQSGKIYLHLMRRNGKEVDRMITKRPDSELWNRYEQDKEDFMDELYLKLKNEQERKLNKEEKKVDNRKLKDPTQLSDRETEIYDLVANQHITQAQVSFMLQISRPAVNIIFTSARKKMKLREMMEQNAQKEVNHIENEPVSN